MPATLRMRLDHRKFGKQRPRRGLKSQKVGTPDIRLVTVTWLQTSGAGFGSLWF
jgi:hypothetical protein